ncbi:LysR family transcriptional regulator [Alkalihalophilus pseudofirmus]|uniref:selenium metabolism-associated LysR family transcriptional regulator n=1 Tax=Alkalihalophilus pseudofirmus TaxID=79885 RepID=UPI000951A6F5|nr:LysR family transcriptional regulator [Alkalihalophilus pseudofirmus]
MNLDHLRVFYTAGTKKNFSETAKVHHLSQPSVSSQIRQLEDRFGVRLFERTTKKIELTESGELLHQYAKMIIDMVDKAEKDVALLSDSIYGELSIGASLTIGENLLPFILGKFKRDFPRVHLLMKIYNSKQIIDKVYDEEIDLGFIEAPMSNKQLICKPFLEDELVVITSTQFEHPSLQGKEQLSTEDLFTLPIILREKGSGTRQVMEETLIKNNLDPEQLRVILELENTESIKATVQSGMGVSIMSQSAIEKELKLGLLKKYRIAGIHLRRHFYVVQRKNKVMSLPTEAFVDFTFNEFSDADKTYMIT